MSMHDHDDFLDDEPPPSYEEAVGSSSPAILNHNHQQQHQQPRRPVPATPPPLPPRTATSTSTTTTNKPNNNYNNNNNTSPTADARPPQPQPQPHPQHHHRPPAQDFAQLLPRSHLVRRQFPPAVNLYREAFPGAPLQQRFFLAEHQPAPLYAVSASPWGGLGAAAALVLHNGPTDDYPPLATVAYRIGGGGGGGAGAGGDPMGRRADVSLPPLVPSGAAPGARVEPVAVRLPTRMSRVFGFHVEVPWGPAPGTAGVDPAAAGATAAGVEAWRRESYEWRPSSHSLAVGGLGGASQGWQLVRLERELPPPAGGFAVAGTGPPSGDGYEVVAACTTAVMSMTKLWKFAFLGTGVSGALGERWAVMAVVTGLVIWDRENRR